MSNMKSDRLVAILLMLQRREQITAVEVAKELEVSVRTARRDLDALAMSGVPIYSIRGRSGGWRLLGGGRIDLTGLTASEARALFLAAGPAATREAAEPALRNSLRKLIRALPETFRNQAEAASAATLVDPRPWGMKGGSCPPEFLDVLQDAVIRGVQARLNYSDSAGNETERIVDPLGLVEKGTRWYLVAHTEEGRRTFRLDRIDSVAPSNDPAHRDEGFDLGTTWRALTDAADRNCTGVEVHALCVPEGLEFLRAAVGPGLRIGDAEGDGRIPVVFSAPSEYGIAGHLAGLVEWLEITGPNGVRDHLAAIGAELIERYGGSGPTLSADEQSAGVALGPAPLCCGEPRMAAQC